MPRPSSGESHKSLRRDRPRHSHTGLSTKNHGGASKGGAGGKYTWGSPQDDVHVASRSIVGSSASAFSSSASSSAAAAAAAGSGDLVPVADDSEEPALSSSSDQQPLSTSDESSSVPDVAYRVLTVVEHDEAHATPRARFHGSPLDKRDGFFHLSVADEVLGTLKRYYGQHPRVVAVKYNLNRLNRRGRRRRASSASSSSSSSSSDDDDDSSSSDDESAEDGSLVYWQRVATRNNALFPHYYGKHLPLKGRTVLAVHHLHRDEATGEFHLPHDF